MNNTKAVTRGMHVGCGCLHPEVTKIIDSTSEIEDKYFERVEKKRERERRSGKKTDLFISRLRKLFEVNW